MSEGYRPQAAYVTKTLIATFVCGVAIGFFIGWGAATSGAPGEGREAPPADQAEATPDPGTETPAPPGETEVADTSATPPGPFDPDVDGLWPAEHLFVGIEGRKADVRTLEWLNEFKPGGVVLGPENVADPLQLSNLVLQIKKAVGLGTRAADPPFILYQDRDSSLPRLLTESPPVQLVDGVAADALEAAVAQARAGREQGIGVVLGPALEFAPAGGGVGDGEIETRAATVARIGLEYTRRVRAAGVLPVAGVFPGEGIARKDARNWHIPEDQMDALAAAMQPFKAAIDAGIPGILVGHVAVPGIDVEQPHRPASLSPKLVQLLVREDWGYDGVLLADDISRHVMTRDLPRDEIALKALFNGCDAVILKEASRADLRLICDRLVTLSKRGDFPADRIEASKRRLETWREQLRKSAPAAPDESPELTEVAAADPPTADEAETAPDADAGEETSPQPPSRASGQSEESDDPEESADPEEPDDTGEPDDPEESAGPETVAPPAGARTIEHTIAQGESLTAIANQYGVSIADLKAWNGLEDTNIKYGFKLKVHVPPDEDEPGDDAGGVDDPGDTQQAGDDAPDETAPSEPEQDADAGDAATPEPSGEEVGDAGAPNADAADAPAPGDPTEDAAPESPADANAPDPDPDTTPTPESSDSEESRNEEVDSDPNSGHTDAGETPADNTDSGDADGEDMEGDAADGEGPGGDTDGGEADGDTDSGEADGDTDSGEVASGESGPGAYEIYEVGPGDNLRRIAIRFGTTQQAIIDLNDIARPDHVEIGWKLKIPKSTVEESESAEE